MEQTRVIALRDFAVEHHSKARALSKTYSDYHRALFGMGNEHMSYKTPEQIAASVLTPLGFTLVNNALMPYSFEDKDGTDFKAMADFYHLDLELYVEIKCDHLNGKTSKATAERAYKAVDQFRRAKYPTYCQTRNQWNHAAAKQALVQSKIGAPQYVIVFTQHPDQETLIRIAKQGIQAYSLARFASIIKLQLGMLET